MTGYIPDGYSDEPGYVAEVPRLHQALRFTCRPMLNEETAEVYEFGAKASAKEAERRSCKIIAERVKKWSLVGPDGSPVPVSEVAVARLKRPLFQAVLGIVMGVRASDEDPESGKPPQTPNEREVADAKN